MKQTHNHGFKIQIKCLPKHQTKKNKRKKLQTHNHWSKPRSMVSVNHTKCLPKHQTTIKNGKKKIQRREHRSIALPWHGGGLAELGAVTFCVRRSGRWELLLGLRGMELCFTWNEEMKWRRVIWLKSRWSEHEQERNMWSVLTVWDRVSRVIYKNTRVMKTENWKQPFVVFSFHNS